MANFKLKAKRELIVEIFEKDIEAKVFFDFPYMEDVDIVGLDKANKNLTDNQIFMKFLRLSIVDVQGFDYEDENENIVPFKDKEGNINVEFQKQLFEYLQTKKGLLDNITLGYRGELDSKNLRIGHPPVVDTDGVQKNVETATSEKVVENVDI